MNITFSVQTHPRITIAHEGTYDGHYVFINSKCPLHHVFMQLAGEHTVDAVLQHLPAVTLEDVRAALHFTGALMAQMSSFPLTTMATFPECRDIQNLASPRVARVHGTNANIADILVNFGDDLDIEQLRQRHILSDDQLMSALDYAALFHRAHREALLAEVRHLRTPSTCQPPPSLPPQNVFRLPGGDVKH